MPRVCARQRRDEFNAVKARSADTALVKASWRWLHRDQAQIPAAVVPVLAKVLDSSPVLHKMVTMREELRQMWLCTHVSRDQLALDLQAWCRRAEESGHCRFA